jgi:hypothetical protein
MGILRKKIFLMGNLGKPKSIIKIWPPRHQGTKEFYLVSLCLVGKEKVNPPSMGRTDGVGVFPFRPCQPGAK